MIPGYEAETFKMLADEHRANLCPNTLPLGMDNLLWSPFRTRSVDETRRIFDEVRKDIWAAVEARKLQLPIDKVYKFDEIGKAFEQRETNEHLGKIAVTL